MTTARSLLAASLSITLGACSLEGPLTRPVIPADTQRELDSLRTRVARSPDDAAARLQLGQAAYKAARYFEAADSYKAALERTPDDPNARAGLADSYSALGYWLEAFEQLSLCLNKDRNQPECLLRIGNLLRSDGGKESTVQARRIFNQFLRIAPNHERAPMVRQLVSQMDVSLGVDTASAAPGFPMFGGAAPDEGALPSGHPSVGEEEGEPPAPHGAAGPAIPGHAAGGGGKDVGELNPFGRAIGKGIVAMRNKDAKTAEAAYQEALTIKKDDSIALAGLAEAQNALGNAAGAEASAAKALVVDPQGSQSRWIYGLVMLKSGKNVEQALAAWRSLEKDDPEYAKESGVTKMLQTIGEFERPTAEVSALPRSVIALGLVSLLTDASSEMIAPLLPAFLVSLGASGAIIGLIEGVAETTSALLKLISGRAADRLPRKKPLVVAGYGIASVVRPLVAIATAPWHVLLIRFVDRIGKGIRSSPRDALIADVTPPERRGAAFGFHRSMDHAGALIGPLVAYALGTWLHLPPQTIFAIAAIPAALAMIALLAGVRETPRPPPTAKADPVGDHAALPPALRGYLAVVALFTLAGSSDAFLLLTAQSAGVPLEQLPLLWAALHASKSVLATPLGALSDRVPRRRLIALGWLLYALVYAAFGFADSPAQIWFLFVAYGAYFGLVEGAEKALVADLAPAALRGRAFGAFHVIVGMAALPASLLFGVALDALGRRVAFSAAAAIALTAAIALVVRRPEPAA